MPMNAESYRRKFVARPEGAALRLVSGPVRPECEGPVLSPLVRAATRPMTVRPEERWTGAGVVGPLETGGRRSQSVAEIADSRISAADFVNRVLGLLPEVASC